MSYLGRPSAGDSPFAIGDRAMRDTTTPQPPHQRNPTPRSSTPQQGGAVMQAPSPYGSVSDEARRRYEERYAKKRAEDEAKRRQEEEQARQAANPNFGVPPPNQQQWGQSPQQHPQQQQQQYQQGHPQGRATPQQQYQQQQPNFAQASPQPQQAQFRPPPRGASYQAQAQGPPQGYGQAQSHPGQSPIRQQSFQPPPAQQDPRQGYTSPPPQQYQQQQQPQQQQQRHSGQQWQQQQQQQQQHPSQAQQIQQAAVAAQHRQSSQGGHSSGQNHGGYQSPPLPQQAEDQELRALFNQFDSARSGQLTSFDLQRLLEKDATMEAREDCVKMLMNIFDTDRSGSINYLEFEGLYRYIQDWHGIFRRFDQDNSGLIDRRELHAALQGFGFSLPSDMVRKLEKRFAPPPQAGEEQRGMGISFDRFLMACVTVKHYTEAFRRFDPNGTGHSTLDYNTFMDIVMDAPS